MGDAMHTIQNALGQGQRALADLMQNRLALESIQRAGQLLVDCFRNGGRVVSCGNGGSLCDAMHFAEELSGRFRKDRAPLAAMAISDPAHISCSANDFGYDEVFARFVMAHCRKGDILFAISTSGTSKNVLRAAEEAKKCGAMVISLTGKKENLLADLSDCHVATPGGNGFSDRVQELHIKCIHILIELVEKGVFGIEY
jgi:D-sedoheptulose 7-phosphate isomerase